MLDLYLPPCFSSTACAGVDLAGCPRAWAPLTQILDPYLTSLSTFTIFMKFSYWLERVRCPQQISTTTKKGLHRITINRIDISPTSGISEPAHCLRRKWRHKEDLPHLGLMLGLPSRGTLGIDMQRMDGKPSCRHSHTPQRALPLRLVHTKVKLKPTGFRLTSILSDALVCNWRGYVTI